MGNESKVEAKHPESKMKIQKAAARVFARKGYAAASMREIAAEAGVNLAMINYFFGSKMGLMETIISQLMTPITELVKRCMMRDLAPQDKFRAFIREMVEYIWRHEDEFMVFLLELPRDEPETLQLKVGFMQPMVELNIEHVFQPMFKAYGKELPMGVIGPAVTGLLCSHFLMKPMINRLRPQDIAGLSPRDYADYISGIYLHGITSLLESKQEERDADHE